MSLISYTIAFLDWEMNHILDPGQKLTRAQLIIISTVYSTVYTVHYCDVCVGGHTRMYRYTHWLIFKGWFPFL